jgi:histone H3
LSKSENQPISVKIVLSGGYFFNYKWLYWCKVLILNGTNKAYR